MYKYQLRVCGSRGARGEPCHEHNNW